jgi:PRTRC genetic system ThiF family protein
MEQKLRWHYLEQYIASSNHKLTVNLIGCGGTGSHMLTNLAVLSHAMVKLGKQPLFVRVFDPDIIEEHNIGRQMFSTSDIGMYKSDVLVTRCNRYFGTEWMSIPELYCKSPNIRESILGANFIISCVDSVNSRKIISSIFRNRKNQGDHLKDGYNHYSGHDYMTSYYWLDLGNNRKTGQIILGTLRKIKQPNKKCIDYLPSFNEEFPKAKESSAEPSCSLAESLSRQDLFINKVMATFASNMLWHLINEFRINYRGIYINLETMKTQPILL